MKERKNIKAVSAVFVIFTIAAFVFFIGGCGEKKDSSQTEISQQQSADVNTSSATTDAAGLTDWQIKHGIGPIKEELKLGPIDKKLAFKGKNIFDSKCAACHKLDERYVGPAQRDLIERRSPEYIMNMILNPAEMLEKNPEAKKMLAEYMTPMTNQNLTIDEARSVLEYFRLVDLAKK